MLCGQRGRKNGTWPRLKAHCMCIPPAAAGMRAPEAALRLPATCHAHLPLTAGMWHCDSSGRRRAWLAAPSSPPLKPARVAAPAGQAAPQPAVEVVAPAGAGQRASTSGSSRCACARSRGEYCIDGVCNKLCRVGPLPACCVGCLEARVACLARTAMLRACSLPVEPSI